MSRTAGLVDGLLADRYRMLDRLAVGGMGEVWRATDVLLDRTVAVKALRAEYVGDEDFRARFRAEARHAARLSHPGIASVHDFGELPDRAWLVMELVDGEPLSALLRREGALDADRTLDLVAQTAAALQAAHDGGVVHRDVKPGNLLVRADGTVKVTDFGIASAVDAAPLTRTGQIVGTAFYLSPEQAAGRGATPATDLYSLGVVAYECLSGARPFAGESQLAVALAHLQSPPPPLPDRVPADVRALVMRLLAKDPDDRPGSAGELARQARALRSQLGAAPAATAGLPVEAYPDEPPTQTMPAPAEAAAPLHEPPDERADERAPTGPTSRRAQRWAVRAALVALVALALALGVRGTGSDAPAAAATTTVPPIAAGVTEAAARSALRGADLTGEREEQASATVGAGRVVAVRPAPGATLPSGASVVLVVSSGPPPVRVTAADLVGRPAVEARAALAAQGLVPRLAYDGSGAAVGTVGAVEPVGDVAVGTPVVLHVVPAPPPPPPAPVPAAAPPAPADPGPARGGNGKGADRGKGKGKGGKK